MQQFMTPLSNVPDPNLPIAALLCFVAYTDDPDVLTTYQGETRSNIEWAVMGANLIYPVGEVVWSAKPTGDANYAFVVCTPSNQYIMAIRGSLPFEGQLDWEMFANWIKEDLNVLGESNWPYIGASTTATSSNVADGAMDAFLSIQGAKDAMGSSQDVGTFLLDNAVQQGHSVIITGHSLGGNIANTFASYLATQVEIANLSNAANYLFTFAAPSPGDAAFVQDLANKFPGGQMYQYQIANDVVPLFPVLSTMWNNMSVLFPSPGPAAGSITDTFDVFGQPVTGTLTEAICAMALAIEAAVVAGGGTSYAESAATIVSYDLKDNNGISPLYEANTLTDWLEQASYQHTCLHYLFIFWGKSANQAVALLAPRLTKSLSAYLPVA